MGILVRIANMIWKEALQFWRYRLLLIFVLIFPVADVLGNASALGAQILPIPTAVYDQDRSPASRRLISMLRSSQLFDPNRTVASDTALEQALAQGDAVAGIVVPQGFGADLAAGREATVHVLLDGSQTTTAIVAEAYLSGAATVYGARLRGQRPGGVACTVERMGAVEARARVWYNEDLREETFNIPAELATVVAMLATFLPAVAIVRERETGTLEQLFVTPLKPIELIVSKALLTLIIVTIGFCGALAVTVFHLRVPLRGSAALLIGLTVCYAFVEMGLGLLISTIAHTQGQALLTAFLWTMLEAILSGQILPVENMPQTMQWLAQATPATHFTDIIRGVMLRGDALGALWPQVGALALIGMALYGFAATRLKKRLD